jgi:ubiquinone/menaquinone biosynthesis C-methylase UbiE
VDIGAGDGWWSERMAQHVGEKGIVYASEVKEEKVKELKQKYVDVVQIKPRLDKTDGLDLLENSCDIAFLSMVYHHFDKGGKVDYLKHLHKIVKPMGRLVVIEAYAEICTERKDHGTSLSRLAEQAEQAGWILVRYQLITQTYHYIAIFVQRELFPPKISR